MPHTLKLRNPNGKKGPKVWIGTLQDNGTLIIQYGSESDRRLKQTVIPNATYDTLTDRAFQKQRNGYSTVLGGEQRCARVEFATKERSAVTWLHEVADDLTNAFGLKRVDKATLMDPLHPTDQLQLKRSTIHGFAAVPGSTIEALLAALSLKWPANSQLTQSTTGVVVSELEVLMRTPNALRIKLRQYGFTDVPVDEPLPASEKPRFAMAW